MKTTHRMTIAVLAFAIGAPLAIAPAAARASEEGRRNTAIALGAAAAGLLLTQRDKTAGIIAGVGAAVAYTRYNDSVNERHRWERYGYYDNGHDRYDRYGRNDRDRYDGQYYNYDRGDRYNRDRGDRYSYRRGDDGYRDGSRWNHRSRRDDDDD